MNPTQTPLKPATQLRRLERPMGFEGERYNGGDR